MKKIYLLLCILVSITAFAQQKPAAKDQYIRVSKRIQAKPGDVLLDSVKIDLEKTFLDGNNIRDYKVIKGGSKDSEGVTLITRKSKPHLFALKDYVQAIKDGDDRTRKAKSVKVVVNGREIKNMEGYMIEKSAVKETKVEADSKTAKEPTIIINTKKTK